MSLDSTVSTEKRLQLSKYMDALVRNRSYSGSVLVTEEDELLIRAAYGMANIELQVPNTPEMKFRIGSMTKQFTAMAMMLLAEQGTLSLEDRLIERMPGLPQGWSDIRLHHLLNHTSGIMHSWDLPNFRDRAMGPFPLEVMVDEIRSKPLLFAPGTGCAYSGIAYFLLAQIIELASGRSYGSFLKSTIFDPLGMADTGGDDCISIIPKRAAGYVRVGEVVQNAAILYTPNLTGGGNLYSTVDDLSRWDRALTAERLISPGSYRALYTAGRDGFGYGWKISQVDGARVIEHGGGVNGFRSHIRRIPERRIGIVILSNSESTGEYLEEMLDKIQGIAIGLI